MKRQSEASILLYKHLKELFPNDDVNPEFRFMATRKFSFDFAVPYRKLAVEIDGVARTHEGKIAGHQSIGGFIKNMEKFNLATAMGWKVLHFTTQQVLKGEAREFIKEWFCPLYKS